jgi:hypothetical protein
MCANWVLNEIDHLCEWTKNRDTVLWVIKTMQ